MAGRLDDLIDRHYFDIIFDHWSFRPLQYIYYLVWPQLFAGGSNLAKIFVAVHSYMATGQLLGGKGGLAKIVDTICNAQFPQPPGGGGGCPRDLGQGGIFFSISMSPLKYPNFSSILWAILQSTWIKQNSNNAYTGLFDKVDSKMSQFPKYLGSNHVGGR
jgi:hypothetical protein